MVVSVTGSSHRLCPPSRLQTWSGQAEQIFARLLDLQQRGVIQGAVLLSTCNRIELLIDADPTQSGRGRLPTLVELADGDCELPSHSFEDAEALRYLLRVACGLESLVRGEEQILGQLREAFKNAEKHRLLSPGLSVLRSQLIAAARETRRQTGLCKSKVSVASLAAKELLRHSRHCVVVGAGETGRLAAETLRRQGVERLLIVNRTRNRAESLARHLDAEAMGLEGFLEACAAGGHGYDGALFAVQSPAPLFTAAHAQGFVGLVDVSMPGVLSPCTKTGSTRLHLDLDGLSQLVRHEGSRRNSALQLAEELIPGKARNLHQYLQETTSGRGKQLGTVLDLHLDTALNELHSALQSKLSHLSDEDQEQLRQLVIRAAKKNAHYHLQDLRQLSLT